MTNEDPLSQAPTSARSLGLDDQVSLLSGQNFWTTRAISSAGIGPVALSDGPHGLRSQGDAGDHLGVASSTQSTCFPPAVTVASSWDVQLAEHIGRAVAVEALATGVDVVLGPALNIKRHPLGGRNFEYYSEDPLLSGHFAAAAVRGLQSEGVGSSLKHFAVNNHESHRFVVDAIVDERTLREIYLAGFEYAVTKAKPWTVMASYNLVNGTYATEHRELLTQILREEWGFDGVVMSDWGATSDRVAAVAAGLDLEMPGSKGLFDGDLVQAARSGRLPLRDIEASAQRVIDLGAKAPRSTSGAIPVDAHDALARRAAAEGTVLLTNDGILPLRAGASLGVIGAFADSPRYQGAGSSLVNSIRVTSVLDECRRRGTTFAYAPGYALDGEGDTDALRAAAVRVAEQSEVVLVMVGLPGSYESEGFDRADMSLPADHDALVAAVVNANPRAVVALSNGAPVLMPWKDGPAAIIESYLGGQASGGALVDVLFGDMEPGGRLAESFPAARTDVSSDPFFPGEPHQVEYREGLFVGYRHHTTSGVEPVFPFGHGLGYTTFGWDSITTDKTRITAGESISISLEVTNTGARSGSDVVQVYLHDRTGVVLRPRRTLVGFDKVRLGAGDTATVTVEIPARGFAFYDVDASDWRTPNGTYELEIARSSSDVVDSVSVEVSGGVDRARENAKTMPIARSDGEFTTRLGRAIPQPRPVRPFTRNSTIGELAANTRIGRVVEWALWRVAPLDPSDMKDENTRATLDRAITELPLRSAAIFSGGTLTWRTVDGVLDIANGRTVRGAAGVVAGLVASLRARRS
ncbi:glycoside hydrolase family 3 C-terminal domain-containing protein [Rhodococcoides yunnanense]|uniref:Glycoside hydrolase family 3 C-terminal domain-containing protein n=1 Tax=Rhodococcoides yunnanense TaxID=278209 RepID=A0ABU4B6J7_9NOCA|nr:glycoside hydrolase family 3 C-terminal domain-containing protein [Rhodococcus yunnanensis]MDV6259816.1 glycoside hydrolase family 3 C-terminal domain-containing protein [Rhodococcus yunnanensis]